MSIKLNNFGVVSGKLYGDINIEENDDGSRVITIVLAVPEDFSSIFSDTMQLISLKGFIDAKQKDNGIFDELYDGVLVSVEYSIQNENTSANSKGYSQFLCIEEISIMEVAEDVDTETDEPKVDLELFGEMTEEEMAENK